MLRENCEIDYATLKFLEHHRKNCGRPSKRIHPDKSAEIVCPCGQVLGTVNAVGTVTTFEVKPSQMVSR